MEKLLLFSSLLAMMATSFSPPWPQRNRNNMQIYYTNFEDLAVLLDNEEIDQAELLSNNAIHNGTDSASDNNASNNASKNTSNNIPRTSIRRELNTRKSSVQSIGSIEEYQMTLENVQEELLVIRFHAPWCKVCQATNVAYERLATKLQRSTLQNPIRFFSVNLNGSTDVNRIKEMLNIRQVPMGYVVHPQRGFSAHINLGRSGLRLFKIQLERYSNGDCDLECLLENSSSSSDINDGGGGGGGDHNANVGKLNKSTRAMISLPL